MPNKDIGELSKQLMEVAHDEVNQRDIIGYLIKGIVDTSLPLDRQPFLEFTYTVGGGMERHAKFKDFKGYLKKFSQLSLVDLYRIFADNSAVMACLRHVTDEAEVKQVMERAEVRDARENPAGDVGRPENDNNYDNIINKNIYEQTGCGTSKQYTLRRLAKEGRDDLLTQVETGELSANAAAIEAGWRKKTITVRIDPGSAAQTIRNHFDDEQIAELVILLDS